MKLYDSFLHSLEGLKACFWRDASFRLEIFAVIILTPVALFSKCSKGEKLILLGSLLLVLIVELLNTAIEACNDAFSTDFHPLIKVSKDIASSAVFLSLIFASICWGVVFFL